MYNPKIKQILVLMALRKKPSENIVGKGENAGYQNFPLFAQCLLRYHREKSSFKEHLIFRLQMLSVWTSSTFCHLFKFLECDFIHTSPNDNSFNSLDWSKLKALADDEINVTQILKSVLARTENIVGKEENVSHQHFFP